MDTYDISDVEQILKNTGATTWNELADFVRTKGNSVWHITQEEAETMADDIELLSQRGEQFTNDPQKIVELLKQSGSKSASSQRSEGSADESFIDKVINTLRL